MEPLELGEVKSCTQTYTASKWQDRCLNPATLTPGSFSNCGHVLPCGEFWCPARIENHCCRTGVGGGGTLFVFCCCLGSYPKISSLNQQTLSHSFGVSEIQEHLPRTLTSKFSHALGEHTLYASLSTSLVSCPQRDWGMCEPDGK